jgi:uncharacterized protein DUF6777
MEGSPRDPGAEGDRPADQQPPDEAPTQQQPAAQPPPQQQWGPPPQQQWGPPPPQQPPTQPWGPPPPQQPGWGQPGYGAPPPPPGAPPPTQQGGGDNRRTILIVAAAVILLAGAAFAVIHATGDDEAKGDTVRFQPPTDPGPDPWTKPTDVKGDDHVRVGSGPFGGTGSDLVCDRELLISSLRARPDRLRAWAAVLGVEPTAKSVARYIRRLRPVTLTRDTRVTNHSFSGGRAVAFQSILQAGTAVLVDSDGIPRVRCRCGNPLAEPVYIAEAVCLYCPANYTPPPPCADYRSCWRRYPDPPSVRSFRPRPQTDDTFREPPPQREPQGVPTASISPRNGGPNDTYTISFANFPPNQEVNIHVTRPDGVEEDYGAQTNASGAGSFTFPRAGAPIPGTYEALVTAGQIIASAQTTVRDEGQSRQAEPPPEQQHEPEFGDVQCDPPRSQEEFERCRDNGLLPEQQGSP